MPRKNSKRPFPVGALVLTPTNRRAVVLRYYADGRAELRYLGTGDDLALRPDLLRKAPA